VWRERVRMKTLLLGCGNSREKRLFPNNNIHSGWGELVTVDMDPNCNPDYVYDLDQHHWNIFTNETFDEVHAYEVFEHIGRQGDYKSFFSHFYECWRILKPGGHLCCTVPNAPEWIWGDPGHTRTITSQSLHFLDLDNYKREIGVTTMTDYRWIWKGNFRKVWDQQHEVGYFFILRKQRV